MSVEKWRLGQPAESGQAEYKNDLLRASTAACVPDRLQLDGLPVLPRFPRLHEKRGHCIFSPTTKGVGRRRQLCPSPPPPQREGVRHCTDPTDP